MNYIADLHIHSPFSRATSPESNLLGLAAWARIKGIQIIGTGDFTHPGWFRQLKELLEPAEAGLFKLKDELAIVSPLAGVNPVAAPVRFLLSAEISSIYKRHGVVRKVHNLIFVPDFASAERMNARLAGIGNIESDGRPILGLDSHDLLEILLELAPEGFLVPAHIWTPWFSLFGSKSGFDRIEDCYGDLTPHIFALETGLSSDPDMNRLISALDRFSLISNSDCHSPSKLGREANLFATGFDYFSLRDALKKNRHDTFRGTVEFFPEEGKYHADGHRTCNVCLKPAETRRLGSRCPVCGKPLTVGVCHRVMEFADREQPLYRDDSPKVFSLIPLPEVLGEIVGAGPASKGVMEQYRRCIARFGSEFNLLLETELGEIRHESAVLGEALSRMREGRVIRKPGFDGEYGVIRVFEEGEAEQLAGQGSLFGDGPAPRARRKKKGCAPLPFPAVRVAAEAPAAPANSGPNPQQAAAIGSESRHLLVTAGPGTGKTYTLTQRLVSLLNQGIAPERLVAITFTVKAAEELRERLQRVAVEAAEQVFTGTFHQFCLQWLRRSAPDLAVIGPESRSRLVKRLFPGLGAMERKELDEEISRHCAGLPTASVSSPPFAKGDSGGFGGKSPGEIPPAPPLQRGETIKKYFEELRRLNAIDLDAVIPELVLRLHTDEVLREQVCASCDHLFVDEFQDLNASQFELVCLLAGEARVFAIGDPDQAIYGFRGSDPEFFYRFADMVGVTQVSLTSNYRCPASVVEAATAVIKHNHRPGGSALVAVSEQHGVIEQYNAPTPGAEAEFIVRRIEELMGGIESFSLNSGRGGDVGSERGLSFGDIAVLFRLGRQGEEIREALERRGIPCQQVGAVPYYLASGLRPVYYFVQAANGSEELADWLQLAAALQGIGTSAIDRLEASLPLNGDFFAACAGTELPRLANEALANLKEILEQFRDETTHEGLNAALRGPLGLLGIDPLQPDVVRLLNLAGSFGNDLAGFSHHLRSHAAAAVYDQRAEAVALMTLHSAKGLEFPVVFMAGLEEGLLPCSLWHDVSVEEERRLFFVGMTRAKQRLILSAAANRPWAGVSPRPLSRFVGEIPAELVSAAPSGKPGKRKPKPVEQMALF